MEAIDIKIPVAQMEQILVYKNLYKKFKHPAFRRKLAKDVEFLSDVSIKEHLIELEYKSGNKYWFDFELFFGKVIMNAPNIFLINENGEFENLFISEVIEEKIKRTKFITLIFSTNTNI